MYEISEMQYKRQLLSHLASRTFPVHRPLGHLYILKGIGQDPKGVET